MTSSTEAKGKLTIAFRRFRAKYVFYSALLTGAPEEAWCIETMAVTLRYGRAILLYNPTFVAGCEIPQLVGALVHETLHVLFGHLQQDPAGFEDPAALTLAQEATVNEFVNEPLPVTPITHESLGIPAGESTITRYHRLRQRRKAVPMGGESVPFSLPGAPFEAEAGRSKPQTDPQSGNLYPENSPNVLDDHAFWEEARADDALNKAALKAAIQAGKQQQGKNDWAPVPTPVRDAAAEIAHVFSPGDAAAELSNSPAGRKNWKAILRTYIGKSVVRQPDYRHPPRRMPHLVGIVPGSSPHPGKPHVMAVIDTSASMDDETLAEISGELTRMSRVVEITVVECDAAIHRVYRFNPGDSFRSVCGRGGTSFFPPFEPAFLRKQRDVDLLVYFTDGYGIAPPRSPQFPVIWCLTTFMKRPAKWGRIIRMSNQSSLETHS